MRSAHASTAGPTLTSHALSGVHTLAKVLGTPRTRATTWLFIKCIAMAEIGPPSVSFCRGCYKSLGRNLFLPSGTQTGTWNLERSGTAAQICGSLTNHRALFSFYREPTKVWKLHFALHWPMRTPYLKYIAPPLLCTPPQTRSKF